MTHAKEVPALHGLRGMAALTVFLSHSMNVYYQGRYFGIGGGQIGVMLFFVLSGYLMSMLYGDSEPSGDNIRQFFVHRFARIYPMFAFAVIADCVLTNFGHGIGTYGIATLVDILRNLFLISGNGPFWTIGPEIIFYVIFAMLWFVRNRSPLFFSIAIGALFIVGMWPGNSERVYSIIILHQRIPYFLIGMLLGMHHERFIAMKNGMGIPAKLLLGAILIVVYFMSYPMLMNLVHPFPKDPVADPSITMWGFPFYFVTIGYLLIGSLLVNPWILTNRAAIFMGKISFPFYMIHVLFLINIQRFMPTHPLRCIVLSLLGAVALSYVLHVVVEVPSRRGIRHWGDQLRDARNGEEVLGT